jgi:hypothetical protein
MWIRDWYGEEIDMFEYYELLPADVQALIYDEVDGYDGCAELTRELDKLGWAMDYYLDAEPHSLRPIIH